LTPKVVKTARMNNGGNNGKQITVNGKVKTLPQHLLKKKKNVFQKKKKNNNNKKTKGKTQHFKAKTIATQDPQLIAQQNYGITNETDENYVSSDTSAEWFDGDEDSDSKAYGNGGYLRVRIGDRLHNRYIIESKLGWGHFSTVWLATDVLAPSNSHRRFVALKIQKSAPHYLDAAKDEVQLLSRAKQKLDANHVHENYIAQMLDSFIVSAHNGKHVVFVFEVLGENLLDLIKSYNYRGLPMAIVKKIAKEVLLGLDWLHTQCGIIHTDLKPENVLISRTKAINMQQLERDKNREIKKQFDRQLKRCEQQMEHSSSSSLAKGQRKKLKQRINELKRNISDIDKKYIVLLREMGDECKDSNNNNNGHTHSNHHHHLNEDDAEYRPPLRAQFEFMHGRYIRPPTDENAGRLIDVASPSLVAPIAKICDLGNACWTDKHFTDDITTRQYRAPESILQVGYDTKVDIWSHACMIFELITGDYLFDPREKEASKDEHGYSRDEDHLALIGELCGRVQLSSGQEFMPWPTQWTQSHDRRFEIRPQDAFDVYLKKLRAEITRPGLVAQFFGGHKVIKRDERDVKWDYTKSGDQLSQIQKLDYWSLSAVLEEKYKIPCQKKAKRECKHISRGHEEAVVGSLAHFLGRMLEIDPSKRATAKEMLAHKWLCITKQDIEECYKSECKWFRSKGKPTADTNANYGLSDASVDGDSATEQSCSSDEEASHSTNHSPSIRTRDPSVDARDIFVNRRAESEPPVTWHKYLGIKWYEQFAAQLRLDERRREDVDDAEHDDKYDDDDEEEDEEEDEEDEEEDEEDEEEEEDDLYAMDPNYDPHERGDEDEEEEVEEEDEEDQEAEGEHDAPAAAAVVRTHVKKASFNISLLENQTHNDGMYGTANTFDLFRNDLFDDDDGDDDDDDDEDENGVQRNTTALDALHLEQRSSVIVHDHEAEHESNGSYQNQRELEEDDDDSEDEEEEEEEYEDDADDANDANEERYAKQKTQSRPIYRMHEHEHKHKHKHKHEHEHDEKQNKTKYRDNPHIQPFMLESDSTIKAFDDDKKFLSNLHQFNALQLSDKSNNDHNQNHNHSPEHSPDHDNNNNNNNNNHHDNNNNNNNNSNNSHELYFNAENLHKFVLKGVDDENDDDNENDDNVAPLPQHRTYPSSVFHSRNQTDSSTFDVD